MNKLSHRFFIFAVLALFLASCISERHGKPRSTGKTNEMLIVTNTKSMWFDTIGGTIRASFAQELMGLPQPEPLFDFYNVPLKNLNKPYKKFHNIFIVDIDPKLNAPIVETKKDLWASPQRVIKISARSEEEFMQIFNEQEAGFLRLFNQIERERTAINYEMANDISLINKINRKFDFNLEVPGSFHIAKQDSNFMWLRHTIVKAKQDIELGIMIYYEDYTDTVAFNPYNIIRRRNQITSNFIPGPSRGSYMVVADKFVPPVFQLAQDFTTEYAVETRGLWEVVNDFMGGSFLSYTFVDERLNRLVTLDGYVYNPNEPKRNYIRHLESIFYTLNLQEN